MTGMAQPPRVPLPTEIGGSVKFLVGFVNSFRTHTVNLTDLSIQATIVQFNQETGLGIVIRTTPPFGFWIVVLIFPDSGRILITALG